MSNSGRVKHADYMKAVTKELSKAVDKKIQGDFNMNTRKNIHHDELLELFVKDIRTKLKKISTEDLETLANDIHIELLERDDSYVNSMDDNYPEGDKL